MRVYSWESLVFGNSRGEFLFLASFSLSLFLFSRFFSRLQLTVTEVHFVAVGGARAEHTHLICKRDQ